MTKTIVTTKAIHQEEIFKAGPQRIYEALLASCSVARRYLFDCQV